MEDKTMFFDRGGKRKSWIYQIGFPVLMTVMLMSTSLYQGAFAAEIKQKTFQSPEESVKALFDAVKADDTKGLLAIFGPAGKEIISSGDVVADKTDRERFIKAYEEMNKLVQENDKKIILHVGNGDWPLPIPIVKVGEKWRFDTKEGKEEMLNRRIGRNELNAIQVCLAIVDAQREYAMKDQDGDSLFEYAQKFNSEKGKKDGLYWEVKEGEEDSPLGPLAAKAVKEGYGGRKSDDKPAPYHGYYYRILKAQGKNAPGGTYDYVVKGKMIGGFGLIAYPAGYGNSGVTTFIVNHDGVVYQKDLGKDTERIATTMTKYDPDKTWKRVE